MAYFKRKADRILTFERKTERSHQSNHCRRSAKQASTEFTAVVIFITSLVRSGTILTQDLPLTGRTHYHWVTAAFCLENLPSVGSVVERRSPPAPYTRRHRNGSLALNIYMDRSGFSLLSNLVKNAIYSIWHEQSRVINLVGITCWQSIFNKLV